MHVCLALWGLQVRLIVVLTTMLIVAVVSVRCVKLLGLREVGFKLLGN